MPWEQNCDGVLNFITDNSSDVEIVYEVGTLLNRKEADSEE